MSALVDVMGLNGADLSSSFESGSEVGEDLGRHHSEFDVLRFMRRRRAQLIVAVRIVP